MGIWILGKKYAILLILLASNHFSVLQKLLSEGLSNGENHFALSLLVFEKMHFWGENAFFIF